MGGNLIPVQRTDRLGRTQRRWVRASAAPTAALPAPVARIAQREKEYSQYAAKREFAQILRLEWDLPADGADQIAEGLDGMGEDALLAAVSALDTALDLAEVATVVRAVRSADESYVRVVCEAVDFTAHVNRVMLRLRYGSPDEVVTHPGAAHLFQVADTAYDRVVWGDPSLTKPRERDQRWVEDASVAFKAQHLLAWMGLPSAGEEDRMELIPHLQEVEKALPAVLSVAEGLRDHAADRAMEPRTMALSPAEALMVARTVPSEMASAAYTFARDRGAFDPEAARAFLASSTPAMSSGIL